MPLRFSWSGHSGQLKFGLANARQTGLACDVALECHGGVINVHAVVLAASSPYFANLLASDTSFSSSSGGVRRIPVDEFRAEIISAIVEFMYLGEVEVAQTDAVDFMAAGNALQIIGLCRDDEEDEETPTIAQECNVKM